ncbi:hypothetical protein Ancab_040638 [Ancistrocladus abbreviatus]
MDMELLSTQNTEGERKEIQHPCHPDPLFGHVRDFHSDLDQCQICHGHIYGRVFGCFECKFYLHDVCAKLPQELQHPSHPTHPLKLRPFDDLSTLYSLSCRLCEFAFDRGLATDRLAYVCDNPNNMCFEVGPFVMHVECALQELSLKEHPLHQHPLAFITENICFENCAACGTKIGYSNDHYSCLDCKIKIHPGCAEVDSPTTSELQAQANQQWRSARIFHWIRRPYTPLLEITVNEGDIRCGLCGSLVNGPAYGCEESELFLHQHCAKMPEYFLHPTHEFPLFINLERDKFVCNLCHLTYEGDDFQYVYKSEDGNFKMHPYCAALKATWHHPRHEHPFVFVKEGHPSNSGNCPACGTEICSSSVTSTSYYLCWTCNISFHARCFDSPKVKHLYRHPDPLTLYFDPVPINYEDKDYYCDFCEEKRDIHTYSYICQKCESEDFNYICHIRCDLFNKHEEVRYKEKLKECERLIAEEEATLDKIQKRITWLEEELHTSLSKKSLCEESIEWLRLKREGIMEMIGR